MARWLAIGLTLLVCAPMLGADQARASGASTVVLTGEIGSDVRLSRRDINVMRGLVRIRRGATLRIQAGATVYCDIGSLLVVEQGARIRAAGFADRPIVFTSAQPDAERRRGDWGGIILNGRAPVGAPGGVVPDEGGTGAYGGYDGADTSGVLRCVRVEYAGYPDASGGRHAAIALRGAGSGTLIDNVEALNGDGAGIGVFGGEVALRHVVAIGNSRAGLACSQGWTGRAQYVVAQQRSDVANAAYAGIVADHSSPMVSNVTLVGGAAGITFGAGARGQFRNVVVSGCAGGALRATDGRVAPDLEHGDLLLTGLLVDRPEGAPDIDADLRAALGASGARFAELPAQLASPFDEAQPSFAPRHGSAALDPANVVAPPSSAFFEPAAFVGAVAATPSDAWLGGWSSFTLPPSPRYLANARDSPEAVAQAFLDGLAAREIPAMQRLRITKNEFCWYVWPELPASQLPNVSCDFAWSQATLNSIAGLAQTLSEFGGRRLELVRLRFAGGDETHPSYVVHYDTRVTVRDESGHEREVKLFGSMLEMNGQYKLSSFVAD